MIELSFHLELEQMQPKPERQVPAAYRRRIGNVVVTALSDGYVDAGIDTVRNIEPSDALAMFEAKLRPVRRASINCFLVHSEGRVALIDTGCGPYFGATAGKLCESLAAAGITLGDIDTVLLTHIHPDHSAGLTDVTSGNRLFPTAKVVVNEKDLSHWFDDDEMQKVDEMDRDFFFRTAREQMAPYLTSLATFKDEAEVFPAVKSVPLYGHTPGHSGYLIKSDGEELLIWGDLVHIPEIQISRPDVTLTFDCDQKLAAASREKLLKDVSSNRTLVAGMHLDFPGFAHVVNRNDSYELLPEPWAHVM